MEWINSLTTDQIMFTVLTVILVICALYLHNLHSDNRNTIYFIDLVTIKGRLSDRKLTRFITWVVTTWGFIYLICTGNLKDWYFYGYIGAWVSNALFGKFIPDKNNEDTPVSVFSNISASANVTVGGFSYQRGTRQVIDNRS